MAQAFNYEQITVSSVVKILTASIYDSTQNGDIHPTEILVGVKDDDIRFTVDGTTPTAILGMILKANESMEIDNESEIRALQMIRVTTDAEVNVTYFEG